MKKVGAGLMADTGGPSGGKNQTRKAGRGPERRFLRGTRRIQISAEGLKKVAGLGGGGGGGAEKQWLGS